MATPTSAHASQKSAQVIRTYALPTDLFDVLKAHRRYLQRLADDPVCPECGSDMCFRDEGGVDRCLGCDADRSPIHTTNSDAFADILMVLSWLQSAADARRTNIHTLAASLLGPRAGTEVESA